MRQHRKAPSYDFWLNREHFADFQEYLNKWWDKHSHEAVRKEFLENPYLGYVVVHDWITNKKDTKANVKRLTDYIKKPEVFVILILGMPGTGKTVTANGIIEEMKTHFRRIVYVSPIKIIGMPSWIYHIIDISELREGDLAIFDEASIRANARRGMSNENIEALDWLAVGRQIGCKIIYITQLSSIADVNIMRWANIIISKGYETSAIGVGAAERKVISDNPILEYLKPDEDYATVPSISKEWSVVSFGSEYFMCRIGKPEWFTDELSKPFRRYIDLAGGDTNKLEELAMTDAIKMRDADVAANVIYREMKIRGYKKSKEYWKAFTGESMTEKKESVDMANKKKHRKHFSG